MGDGRGRVRSAGGDQCPHTGGHRGLNTKWRDQATGHQETRTWGHGTLLYCTSARGVTKNRTEQREYNNNKFNKLIAFKLNIIYSSILKMMNASA